MNEIIKNYEQTQIQQILKNSKVTDFGPGDTVKVNVKIKEGNKERVQAFQGVCIGKKNNGLNSSFSVRKISSGEGVERVFPLYSNVIESIERIKVGDVRRAKLYYLRELSGKKARISERTDGRAYDDEQYVSSIEDVVEAPAEKAEFKPLFFFPMQTPWKAWTLSLFPSLILTLTLTVSPGPKSVTFDFFKICWICDCS